MVVGETASTIDGDLLARLRDIATSRDRIDIAQLQFVGLDAIRDAYGDRWPHHRNRIQDSAETFLRKRMAAGDLLVRGEAGFLVVLASTSGPQAHAAAAQLTHALNAFYTGHAAESPAPRFAGVVQNVQTRDLEKALSRSNDAPIPAANADAAPPDWRFEPVWDVKRETLSYWYVTPFGHDSTIRLAGYQFETCALNSLHLLRTDEAALWIAEAALQDLADTGRQALIGTAIHVHSLMSLSSRARLFATIERLNPDLHRYRIVKIAGVAQGFPRLYLREIVGALRSRLPNIMLLAAWDEPDIAGLLQPGLSGIGLVAPGSGVAGGPVTAIPALIARANEARRQAHAARMRFFVEGAVTKFLALKFAQAGVDNIASQNIWPARVPVGGLQKWPADLLAAA
jgi:hypothetical protein